jgi:hypothetical protein
VKVLSYSPLSIKKYLVYQARLHKYTPDKYIHTPVGDLYPENLKWCIQGGFLRVIDGQIQGTPKTASLSAVFGKREMHESTNNSITRYRNVKLDFDYKNRVTTADVDKVIADYERSNPDKVLKPSEIDAAFDKMTAFFQKKQKEILLTLTGLPVTEVKKKTVTKEDPVKVVTMEKAVESMF